MLSFPAFVAKTIKEVQGQYYSLPQQSAFIKQKILTYGEESKCLCAGEVDRQNMGGETALHLVLRAGYEDCADLLLFQLNARTTIQDKAGITALHLIIKQGYSHLFKNIPNDSDHFKSLPSLLRFACDELAVTKTPVPLLEILVFLINKGFLINLNKIQTYCKLRENLDTLKKRFEAKPLHEGREKIFFDINAVLDFVEKHYPRSDQEQLKKASLRLRTQFR